MNFANKFARFMRNSGPARVLIPIGIILIVFGAAAFILYLRKYFPAIRLFSGLLAVFGAMLAAVPFAIAGFAYISLGLHDWLLKPRDISGPGSNPYITYRN